jgi:hypothetical protein
MIFLARIPISLKKGGTGPLFEEKGGTSPLFDTASPPFAEKRRSRQISNSDRKYQQPNKSDTCKIPIPKKLLVTLWYTTLIFTMFHPANNKKKRGGKGGGKGGGGEKKREKKKRRTPQTQIISL